CTGESSDAYRSGISRCRCDCADRGSGCPWRWPGGGDSATSSTEAARANAGAIAAADGTSRAGESGIDGAGAAGRRPAPHPPRRHAGDGPRRPGGLHHPRQERSQQRRRGHGPDRGHHREPRRPGSRGHHRLRRVSRHWHTQDRRRLARAEFRPGRKARVDHLGPHPQPGATGAGIQAGATRGGGWRGRRRRRPALERGCSTGEVILSSAPAPRDTGHSKRRRVEDDKPAPKRTLPPEPPIAASRRSRRGLDWFAFCVADVQTGFGPFVSVYLTAQGWTQIDLGLALTARSLAGLALQMPGGAIVDAARSERRVAALAMIAISASALVIALWPIFPSVLGAQVLHAAGSSVVSPALAAISLGLVGHAASGERFAPTARSPSIANGLPAPAMAPAGHFWSNQAVFLVTAALIIPTLLALAQIRSEEIDPVRAHGGSPQGQSETASFATLMTNRPLLTFAACVTVFQLANAAMLPLM